MTVAWKLLIAGGGSAGFVSPENAAFEVLAAPNGAWPSWTHAFYNSVTDSTLFGFVNSSGSVRIGEYDNAAGTATSTEVGVLAGDQHNAPAVIRRLSDGRYVALMSDHAGSQMYVNISTNPDDNSAWAGTEQLDDELGGSAYTYPFICQLDDETNDPIYLFCRNQDASDHWLYSKSTGGGANGTWAALTEIVAGVRHYARFVKSSEARIDMTITDGSYAEDFASIYHAYYEGGDWHESDGTVISGLPFTVADMTLVYDGSTAGARIPNSIAKLGSDIVITFPVFTGTPSGHIGEDGDYVYARWNGSAWSTHTIVADIGMTDFDFSEGGVTVDPSNLDRVALAKRNAGGGGTWHMFLYETPDEGASWSSTQITSTGDEDRYPWWVLGHAPELLVIWQKGESVTEDDFTVGVWGYGTG